MFTFSSTFFFLIFLTFFSFFLPLFSTKLCSLQSLACSRMQHFLTFFHFLLFNIDIYTIFQRLVSSSFSACLTPSSFPFLLSFCPSLNLLYPPLLLSLFPFLSPSPLLTPHAAQVFNQLFSLIANPSFRPSLFHPCLSSLSKDTKLV